MTLSVSVLSDINDPVFDDVGLAGSKGLDTLPSYNMFCLVVFHNFIVFPFLWVRCVN